MQILLIRPAGANVWIEFNGPPEALPHFRDLIDSVTAQLASLEFSRLKRIAQ